MTNYRVRPIIDVANGWYPYHVQRPGPTVAQRIVVRKTTSSVRIPVARETWRFIGTQCMQIVVGVLTGRL